jgi:hypothetical protein
MARHVPGIPAMRCTARAKTHDGICRNWAIPGTTVCRWHGANRQTRQAADRRSTLAQLLAADPRPVWQVVLDAVHRLDCLARDHQVKVLAGETVSVEALDRLVELSKVSHHLAQTAIATKAAEHLAQGYVDQGNRLAKLITEVVDRLELTVEWRIFALQVVHHLLQIEAGEESEEPSAPDDPLMQERVTGVTIVDSRAAIEGSRPTVPSVDYFASLNDGDLRSLGELVADELEKRRIYD